MDELIRTLESWDMGMPAQSQRSQQQDDPIATLMKNVPTASKQDLQQDRYEGAFKWAYETGGGDAPIDQVLRSVGLPGNRQLFGIRPRDVALPFQSAITAVGRMVTGSESDAEKLKKAREAFERGDNSITDEQLNRLAITDFEAKRSEHLGFGGQVAQGLASVPAMVTEQLAGAAAVQGAAKAIGGVDKLSRAGRLFEGATTKGGQIAQNVGLQVAATPLTPSLYLKQAEENQAKNGGALLAPENVGIPLFRAAATNAIAGHVGGMTKNLPIYGRIAAGGAIMPTEMAAADAIVGLGEDLFVKAGMPEKLKSENQYGTAQMFVEGKHGEAWRKIATESIMGGMFAAFHSGKPGKQIELMNKAADYLAEQGKSPEEAGQILLDNLTKPIETIKDKPVKDLVESLAETKQPEKPKQVDDPFANYEPAKPEIVKPAEQSKPDPLMDYNESELDMLAKSIGFKDKKAAEKSGALDMMRVLIGQSEKVGPAKNLGKPSVAAEATKIIESNDPIPVPKIDVKSDGLTVDSGKPFQKNANGDMLTRHAINDAKGNEIGEVKAFQSGGTLHVDWMGLKDSAATDQSAKGAMGARGVIETFRQLAEQYPTAIAIKYTPASGRIRPGATKWIDLEKIRQRATNSTPSLKEERNAIQAEIQSGQRLEVIAERILADEKANEQIRQDSVAPATRTPEVDSQDRAGRENQAAEVSAAQPVAEDRSSGPGGSGNTGSAGNEIGNGIRGNLTTVAVAGSKAVPAQYEVRELSSIIASHGVRAGGGLRSRKGEYPEGIQPRDYTTDRGEQEKVQRFAKEMETRHYLSDDPNATGGPSTITPEGIVLNGNGRQMSLEEAVRIGTFGKYRDQLLNKAEQFGIEPEAVKGMKQPVLVRVVNMDSSSKVAAEFAARGNVNQTQSQSPVRRAESLGRLVDRNVIDSMKHEGDTTFAEAVTDLRKGAAFRKKLRESLPASEVSQYFTEADTLTDAGKELVRNMLLTKVIPADVVAIMQADMKAEARTLEGAIPQLLQLSRTDAINPTRPLVEAVGVMARNPKIRSVKDADNILSQKSLFGGQAETISKSGRMMLDFLLNDGQKPLVFRKKLERLINDHTQSTKGLFAEPQVYDPVESAARNLGVAQREGARFETGDLSLARPLTGDDTAKGSIEYGREQSIPMPSYKSETRATKEATPTPETPKPSQPEEFGKPLTNEEISAGSVGGGSGEGDIASQQSALRETQLANAKVDQERIKNGLPPLMSKARMSNPEVWDAAMMKLANDPNVSARLVEELIAKNRATTIDENALLLHRKIALSNEYSRSMYAANDAMRKREMTEFRRLGDRADELLEQINKLDRVTRDTGTEWGRAGQFRKQLAAEDYSLGRMMGEAMRAKQSPLTDAEKTKITELNQTIEKLQKRLTEFDAMKEQPEAKPDDRGIIAKIGEWLGSLFPKKASIGGRAQPKSKAWEYADQLEKQSLKEMAATGRDKFYSISPEILIPMAKYTAAKIIKTGLTLADYTKAIIAKYGESARPQIQGIWDQAQQHVKDSKMDAADVRIDLKKNITQYTEIVDKFKRQNRSVGQKVIDTAKDSNNLVRAVITAWDYSAPFRQGAMLTLGHPVKAVKSLGQMFKSGFSERSYERSQDAIKQRPNAKNGLYDKSGLYIAETDGSFNMQEEAFIGRLTQKIPGLAGSQRAFNSYLNTMRVEVFDAMAASLARNGNPSLKETQAIANYINKSTGRGTLPGSVDHYAAQLAQVFFSPRYLASRLQILAGQPFYGGTMRTRGMIAMEYGRALAGLGLMYTVAKLFNDDMKVTFDPRSSDFGKMQFGKTRVDPLAGLSQLMVFLTRFGTGESVSTDEPIKVKSLRGPNYKPGTDDVGDTVLRFTRNKMSPIAGEVSDVFLPKYAPKNVGIIQELTGDKGKITKYADKLVPISVNDIYDAMKDQGMPRGAALSLLAILGMGTQVYEDRVKKSK